jgi:hypothetical protein
MFTSSDASATPPGDAAADAGASDASADAALGDADLAGGGSAPDGDVD